KRELRKIKTNLDGVRRMSRMPGVVIVIDARKEYIALREARKLGIPTIAVTDTDSDPDTADVIIPANDDSIKAIELLMNQLATAVAEGKTMVRAEDPMAPAARPKRTRSSRRVLASAADEAPAEAAPVAAPAVAPAAAEEKAPAAAEVKPEAAPAAPAEAPAEAPAAEEAPAQ
ncbi:MAG: 30S ribosomal protein S2, partial [Planctomycetota bacterium]